MRRCTCLLLCIILLCTSALCVEIRSPSGSRTMTEQKAFWDIHGYPESIAYVVRSVYQDSEPGVESWTIGVVGDASGLEELLSTSISNDCDITFADAQYSRNELLTLYPDVVRDYCRDLAFGSISIQKDRIVVSVSPFLLGLYQKSASRKYNGRVQVVSTWQFHEPTYDENGNLVSSNLPILTFELFVGFALLALFLILIGFAIWKLIRRIRKRSVPSDSQKERSV